LLAAQTKCGRRRVNTRAAAPWKWCSAITEEGEVTVRTALMSVATVS
jgi:hypothetical protein